MRYVSKVLLTSLVFITLIQLSQANTFVESEQVFTKWEIVDDYGDETKLFDFWMEGNNICLVAKYKDALTKDKAVTIDKKEYSYPDKLPVWLYKDGFKYWEADITKDTLKTEVNSKSKLCYFLNPIWKDFDYHIGKESVIIRTITGNNFIPSSSERLIRNSTGQLNALFYNTGSDPIQAWSLNNGTNWVNSSILSTEPTTYSYNLVVDSQNGLHGFYYANYDIKYINKTQSNSYSVSIIYDGNNRNIFDNFDFLIDANDTIHYCIITSSWNGSGTAGDFLIYGNKTLNGTFYYTTDTTRKVWNGSAIFPGMWLMNDSTKEADRCDIDIDTNNNIYVLWSGSDEANIRIMSSIDNWTAPGFSIYDYSSLSNGISLSVDTVNNNLAVAFDGTITGGVGQGKITVANTSQANWKNNWSVNNWTLSSLNVGMMQIPHIKTYNNSVYMLGFYGNSTMNFSLWYANSTDYFKSNKYLNMTFFPNRSSTALNPTIRGETFPTFNRFDGKQLEYLYFYANSSNTSVTFIGYDNITVGTYGEAPASNSTCSYTSGNWAITCSDACNFSSAINIGKNNWTATGSGQITGVKYLKNYSYGTIKGGCIARA